LEHAVCKVELVSEPGKKIAKSYLSGQAAISALITKVKNSPRDVQALASEAWSKGCIYRIGHAMQWLLCAYRVPSAYASHYCTGTSSLVHSGSLRHLKKLKHPKAIEGT
jgi:hypothetical protein